MMFIRLLLFLVTSILTVRGVELGSRLKDELATPKVRIVLGLDVAARYKFLDNLKTELHSLQQEWGAFIEHANQKSIEIKRQIEELKSISPQKTSSENIRKINLLHKVDGIVLEIKDVKLKILELLQQHIEFLSQQIANTVQPNNALEEKSLYTFFDFQGMSKKMFVYEDQVRQLLTKKDELFHEITRQEHLVVTKEKDFGNI